MKLAHNMDLSEFNQVNGYRLNFLSSQADEVIPPVAELVNKQEISAGVIALWKCVFPLSDAIIETAAACVTFWQNPVIGEREIYFALSALVNDTFRVDGGYSSKFAPANVEPASLRQSLRFLSEEHLSFDPVITTAYYSVSICKHTKKSLLEVQANYKGAILHAKSTGLIKDVFVELVYEKDNLIWRGDNAIPNHQFDRFAPINQRGRLRGGYAVTLYSDNTVESLFVDVKTINKIASMTQSPSIMRKWRTKMLEKGILKQCSHRWYNKQDIERVNITSPSLKKYRQVEKLLAPFTKILPDTNDPSINTKINVIKYSLAFFDDYAHGAASEAEHLINLVVTDKRYQNLSPHSFGAVMLAMQKYKLTFSQAHQHAFVAPQKLGVGRVLRVGVMYKGLRQIAFNQPFSQLAPIESISYGLVRSHDEFHYQGRFKSPVHKKAPTHHEDDCIGGYVTIHRGNGLLTTLVSREVMNQIGECARTDEVKSNWTNKYLEKTLLRQAFFDWL